MSSTLLHECNSARVEARRLGKVNVGRLADDPPHGAVGARIRGNVNESRNNLMLGMTESAYNRVASSHSQTAIFTWLLGGYIYIGVTEKLASWESLLLFFPGIFVASLISMLTFLVGMFMRRSVAAMGPGTTFGKFIVLGIVTIVLIVLFLAPIAAAMLFVITARRLIPGL